MKKTISICIVAMAMAVMACSKNSDAPASPESSPLIASSRITMVSNLPYDLKKEYSYDSLNRLKQVSHSGANTASVTEKYFWSPDKLQYKYYVGSTEAPSVSLDYILSNGKVSRSNSAYYNSASLYEYNNNGYVVRVNYVNASKGTGYQLYYYSSDNQLDSVCGFSAESVKRSADVFVYETGKRNTLAEENFGLRLTGKGQSAPLRRKIWYTYDHPVMPDQRVKYIQLDYAYEYDNAARIRKRTTIETQYSYPSGTSSSYIKDVMEYTYK